jgi:hypothetical protein
MNVNEERLWYVLVIILSSGLRPSVPPLRIIENILNGTTKYLNRRYRITKILVKCWIQFILGVD